MLARVSHAGIFVMLTWCFVVAGTQTATAQALCPEADVRAFDAGFLRGPKTITVETDLRALGGTLPGGTWRMPNPGGLAWDGVALEGVSFTRNTEPEFGPDLHTFDVVVDLRGWNSIVTDLEFIVFDGERSLPLGAFTGIALRCEATRGVPDVLDHRPRLRVVLRRRQGPHAAGQENDPHGWLLSPRSSPAAPVSRKPAAQSQSPPSSRRRRRASSSDA
jgi:hypothetical protein